VEACVGIVSFARRPFGTNCPRLLPASLLGFVRRVGCSVGETISDTAGPHYAMIVGGLSNRLLLAKGGCGGWSAFAPQTTRMWVPHPRRFSLGRYRARAATAQHYIVYFHPATRFRIRRPNSTDKLRASRATSFVAPRVCVPSSDINLYRPVTSALNCSEKKPTLPR
jgi:hypothetical protein